jgi:hypothetical protein
MTDWYQQDSRTRTVAIFGEAEDATLKHVERTLFDREAYEAAQGCVYLSELAALR